MFDNIFGEPNINLHTILIIRYLNKPSLYNVLSINQIIIITYMSGLKRQNLPTKMNHKDEFNFLLRLKDFGLTRLIFGTGTVNFLSNM